MDDRCECGQSRSESFDPNGPDYQATPLRCRACEAREAMESQWKRDDHADLHGIKFAVTERRDG